MFRCWQSSTHWFSSISVNKRKILALQFVLFPNNFSCTELLVSVTALDMLIVILHFMLGKDQVKTRLEPHALGNQSKEINIYIGRLL